jgi:Asp-tRNA(Asn)/Glu-tRNA(Gln) amidotransferase A subunit family amidase
MTIKDTYQTAGMRTMCGLEAWDHVPDHDAETVRRLRGAGAVIFGKTNTPALAGDWQTFNPILAPPTTRGTPPALPEARRAAPRPPLPPA